MRKKRNICEYCEHYKAEYAPYIKRMVMTCELEKRNPMCHGNYKPKKKEGEEDDSDGFKEN